MLPERHRLYPDNDFVLTQNSTPSHQAKATQNFCSRQHAPLHQLARMDTTRARPESAGLLNLGHLARTCLRRKAWTACKPQRSSERYQRQVARCRCQKTVRKAILKWKRCLAAAGKAERKTYSTHFLLISWLMITVTFWCSLCMSDNKW